MEQADHTFGGRIRPQEDAGPNWAGLVELANEGIAFVYQRLSSHEQVKRHIYSRKAQDALVDLAKDDGYDEDQITVEDRDLGISGTKGQEDRPGLAHLIQQVEAGLVESVYVVHISRLYRDQTLINALSLGELFKENDVIIVTPQMRLNLRDRMHMRLYRMEVERAADELELMQSRLGGARALKGKQGYYTGRSIPPGFVLDVEKTIVVDGRVVDNPNYHKYIVNEPHAEIVRWIFRAAMIPGITVTEIVRRAEAEGIAFSPFPEELSEFRGNLKAFARSKKNPDGSWPLTVRRVRSILRNPAYIGWWIWGGEVVSTDNHPAIVDEETFWAAQTLFGERRVRPRKEHPPLPLAGLLYCGEHDVPRRMIYSHGSARSGNIASYQCRNDLGSTHCVIKAEYLDGPVSEAVISQCAYPELADQVLNRLTQEYEETKAHAETFRREHARLAREIENLEHNFASAKLTPGRAARLEAQIQERLDRIRELANLQGTEMGKLVGPAITQNEVELVKRFLANLKVGWEAQPPELKNAFLQLVLERVIVVHSPSLIQVRLVWRTGLEQELVVHRPYFEPRRPWKEEEISLLETHFETMPWDQLMDLFPKRTWRQIRRKGRNLGLKRERAEVHSANCPYEPWEDEIIDRYRRGEFPIREALRRLGRRTEDSVRSRLKKLGLKRGFDGEDLTWEWVDTSNVITSEHLSNHTS